MAFICVPVVRENTCRDHVDMPKILAGQLQTPRKVSTITVWLPYWQSALEYEWFPSLVGSTVVGTTTAMVVIVKVPVVPPTDGEVVDKVVGPSSIFLQWHSGSLDWWGFFFLLIVISWCNSKKRRHQKVTHQLVSNHFPEKGIYQEKNRLKLF